MARELISYLQTALAVSIASNVMLIALVYWLVKTEKSRVPDSN